MSARLEVLVSGSRSQGIECWDVHSAAPLFSHSNARLAPSTHCTSHSHTATGQHQLITVDPAKPLLHSLTFSLSSTSPSFTVPSTSSTLPSPISALVLSPSSLYLVTASSTSPTLSLYAHSSPPTLLTSFPSSHYLPITCLAFTPDERFIISGSEDGCVHATALTDALHSTAHYSHPLHPLLPPTLTPHPHPTLTTNSPSNTGEVRVHCSFASHSLPITSLTTCPGSSHSLVFSSSLDHSVHVHSLVSHATQQRFVFPCAIACVTVTSTLSAMFAGGTDGTIYHQPLIHAAAKPSPSPSSSSSSLTSLTGHTLPITCLSLSFDCSLLASTSRDGSLRMWDVRTLQCLRVVKKVGRTSFDWCQFVREVGLGRDWGMGRVGGRRWAGVSGGEGEGAVRVAVKRWRVGRVGEEGQRWEEFMEDWRGVMAQDEVSRLRQQLERERARRERAEAEVARWSEQSKKLYGVTVRQAMKRRRTTVEAKGEEEKQLTQPTAAAAGVQSDAEEANEEEEAEEEGEEEERMRGEEEADQMAEAPVEVVGATSEVSDGDGAEKRQRSSTEDSAGVA